MNKWLRFAVKIACINRTKEKNFSLGAVLIKGGSIISTGTNKKKTDPVIKFLSSKIYCETHKYRMWMHAELDCINRIPVEITKNAVLYVARVTKDGRLANANPCKICRHEIKKAGIKKVHYTLNNNSEVILYLNDYEEEEELINENIDSGRSFAMWEGNLFSIQSYRN